MLEHPVGAAIRALEACCYTIAGGIDAIFVIEVHHGNDASDVDAGEVAYASTIVGGGLKLGEFAFGDFSFADGVVVVFIGRGEYVDGGVVILFVIADAETEVG